MFDIKEFIIYLTMKCNYSCKMCTQEYLPEYKELNADEWDKIFEKAEKVSPQATLVFLGGCPFLYKDIDIILKRAYKRQFHPHIVTNGSLFEWHFDTIVETYTGITLSIDGLEKTHNSLRNSGYAFQKAENALKMMFEFNKNIKDDRSPIFYNINFVMQPENLDQIIDFAEWVMQYEPKILTFSHPRYISDICEQKMSNICYDLYGEKTPPYLKTRRKTVFSEEYVRKLYKIMQKLHSKYENIEELPKLNANSITEYYGEPENGVYGFFPERRCLSPDKVPTIMPDGTLKSCIYNNLGNLLENSFEELWTNKIAEDTRKYLESNGNFPACGRCTCFYKEN